MRIEKIELIGFKSFADRIEFTLHPGITCIVGPNGCGKSNIVDAFRWVLGEQSAKSLRGEKMEEVIFNGSALKKPKGMAEVTMVVSGLNGAAQGNGHGEGDTVTISRRLYRSGESEYMLNRNSCRLRDIRDIFLDTGLDFRSYSILEQGRIGEILNSKPLERRFIIEEVAGVMKYKVRKAEALSKLESSRANLIRINDIILEVKKQINILDRLAKKAERYKKLSTEMHEIELKMARKEYQTIKESYSEIRSEYAALKEKETFLSAEISETENKTQARRLRLMEREKELEAIQTTYQGMEREIAEIERAIAVGKNDIDNLSEYQERLTRQEEEVDARSIEVSAKCEVLESSAKKLAEDIESHAEVHKAKAEHLRTAEEALIAQEEQIEDKRRDVFRISEELSSLRSEVGRQNSSLESFMRRESSVSAEVDNTRHALAALESSINEVESSIHSSNNDILFLNEKKEVLLGELSERKVRLETSSSSLSVAREELASCLSRLDSLKEIVFDSPTREYISAGTHVNLIASLTEVIDVSSEYEKAVEGALAEKADLFILESRDDVVKAVVALKDRDFGKSAFITLNPPRTFLRGERPADIIGGALEFIRVKSGFETVAENLLGNVLIVKDLRTALSIHIPDGPYVFVTLEGEVVEPSGSVVVGGDEGIFRRKREIKELEELRDAKKAEIEDLSAKIHDLQSSTIGKEDDLKSAESALFKIEKDISIARLTADNYSEERERASRKLAYLNLELEEIAREREALKKIMEDASNKILTVEERKREAENEAVCLQEEMVHKKSEIEEYRSEVTELRLMTASGRERIEALKNELESSRTIIAGFARQKVSIDTERREVLSRIARRESEVQDKNARARELIAEADTIRMTISGKKDDIEKENEDLLQVDQGLKVLRQQSGGMISRISEIDVLIAEHKMRLENLYKTVLTNYGKEIEHIEVCEVSEEDQQRLAELKNKIQEIGPVNLGTLEEYEELKSRFDFLSQQQQDLTKSIAELEEAISKINSTTRRRLREAFDELNAKFGEVFLTLFGGGKAELVLTDPHNILESGIEIIAQPPGKKLQNIHLLSGGEKALTALSIQFASFLIKPTPLCILDEADAPLDESNTERFSRMLNELSKETQFIVVTHNRTTMSVAQNLYGITMEEAGISKVISMQLAEA